MKKFRLVSTQGGHVIDSGIQAESLERAQAMVLEEGGGVVEEVEESEVKK